MSIISQLKSQISNEKFRVGALNCLSPDLSENPFEYYSNFITKHHDDFNNEKENFIFDFLEEDISTLEDAVQNAGPLTKRLHYIQAGLVQALSDILMNPRSISIYTDVVDERDNFMFMRFNDTDNVTQSNANPQANYKLLEFKNFRYGNSTCFLDILGIELTDEQKEILNKLIRSNGVDKIEKSDPELQKNYNLLNFIWKFSGIKSDQKKKFSKIEVDSNVFKFFDMFEEKKYDEEDQRTEQYYLSFKNFSRPKERNVDIEDDIVNHLISDENKEECLIYNLLDLIRRKLINFTTWMLQGQDDSEGIDRKKLRKAILKEVKNCKDVQLKNKKKNNEYYIHYKTMTCFQTIFDNRQVRKFIRNHFFSQSAIVSQKQLPQSNDFMKFMDKKMNKFNDILEKSKTIKHTFSSYNLDVMILNEITPLTHAELLKCNNFKIQPETQETTNTDEDYINCILIRKGCGIDLDSRGGHAPIIYNVTKRNFILECSPTDDRIKGKCYIIAIHLDSKGDHTAFHELQQCQYKILELKHLKNQKRLEKDKTLVDKSLKNLLDSEDMQITAGVFNQEIFDPANKEWRMIKLIKNFQQYTDQEQQTHHIRDLVSSFATTEKVRSAFQSQTKKAMLYDSAVKDMIFCNRHLIDANIIPVDISDHSFLCMTYDLKQAIPVDKQRVSMINLDLNINVAELQQEGIKISKDQLIIIPFQLWENEERFYNFFENQNQAFKYPVWSKIEVQRMENKLFSRRLIMLYKDKDSRDLCKNIIKEFYTKLSNHQFSDNVRSRIEKDQIDWKVSFSINENDLNIDRLKGFQKILLDEKLFQTIKN